MPRSADEVDNNVVRLPVKPVMASPYVWREPKSLPRRPWVYGRQLIRGCVFLVLAPGGTGKSALTTGVALALCTGRPLLGHEVWEGRKRVWLWNLEDSLNDMAFSIQAAALHWELSPADLDGRLFVDSGLEGSTLRLARMERDGAVIDREASAAIEAEILARGIDVLVVDPFISSHGLPENDNAAIDLVAKEWARIATAANCAVVLVHHCGKPKSPGEAVTANSSRGASSLVDAARGGLALNTMTDAEADAFGIDRGDQRRFFRADSAKSNRSPAGAGEWFELVSVHLENGPNGGDSVGVATPWSPPDPFDDVTTHHLRAVQAKVADGDWKENPQAQNWVGQVVADVLDLDLSERQSKAKVSAVLKTWIKNGALRVVERQCPVRREPKKFVAVGEVA